MVLRAIAPHGDQKVLVCEGTDKRLSMPQRRRGATPIELTLGPPESRLRPVEFHAFGFVAERLKETGCPIVNVIRAKSRHHDVPAILAFFERHGQGARDGGGSCFDIVGIDDQGAF